MDANLACDKFWVNKNWYHDAEKKYYENIAKLQRRLGILGRPSEELNNIKLSEMRNYEKTIGSQSLRKKLVHLEVKEIVRNKISESDLENNSLNINKSCENNENSTNSEKKKQNKKRQKESQEKKNKSEKKANRLKENEDKSPGGVGVAKIDQETFPKTSLAGEVAKARQHIKSSLECMENVNGLGNLTNPRLTAVLEKMEKAIENLTKRVEVLERECATCKKSCTPAVAVCPPKPQSSEAKKAKAEQDDDDDDDVDLFGSESEEENEEAKKIREQRLAEYAAKKSKKPGPIAKSNIILDIKPWDDETDLKEMEKAVRAVEMDGLIWGASKLVPLAFKIFKLQISCVIEDEKVSVDLLTETLEGIEEYIQSVDIAAFNKV